MHFEIHRASQRLQLVAMVPRRSVDERKLVLQMHERGSSYFEISAFLEIPRSTYHDVVRRFSMRGDLRDAHSEGRP